MSKHQSKTSKHKASGWTVSQPGSKPVHYPTKKQAKGVAKQLTGGKAKRAGGWLGWLFR